MAFVAKKLTWIYHEFGLSSLRNAGRDTGIIILTRCFRMVAYGTNSLILALFFSALEFTDVQIGLFMSLTLIGDVLLSTLLTIVADGLGRRRVLFAGSALMVFSGSIFALFDNFWVLLFAAVVGVISPTGGEIGPFRAVEESTLSHLTTPQTRADVLSWYVTTATIGSCIGTEVSGRFIQSLQDLEGWTITDAYHACFWVYTVMGALNMALSLLLSEACEARKVPKAEEYEILLVDSSDEEDNEDSKPTPVPEPAKPKKQSLFAQISPETRSIMYRLSALFAIDSLAGGMMPYSLTNYYVDQKFHLSKATLGDVMSVAYLLSAVSTVFAGPLTRHLGPILAMCLSHGPSSLALAFIPLPSSKFMTFALILFRASLSSIDQAPRVSMLPLLTRRCGCSDFSVGSICCWSDSTG
jgi:MFS family permease